MILVMWSCDQTKETSTQSPEVETAESLSIQDLNGATISLEQYIGKTVIVNLWATWCKPCIKEMPSFERLIEKLPADDFVFLFASNEDQKLIQKFIERRKFDLKFIQLKSGYESLGAYSLPTTLIYDKNGELVDTYVGSKEWDTPETIAQLTKTHKK
jgi:thiol-disulfide isomerase/thioredoxin